MRIFDTSHEGGRAGVLEIGNKGYVEFTVRGQSVVVLQLPRVVPCWSDGLFLPILYSLRIPRSDHRVPSVLKESWLPGTQTRSNPQRAKNVVGATDYASSSTANCRQHGYRQRDGKADDEHPHRGSTHDHRAQRGHTEDSMYPGSSFKTTQQKRDIYERSHFPSRSFSLKERRKHDSSERTQNRIDKEETEECDKHYTKQGHR